MSTVFEVRRAGGCLAPRLLDDVLADPERVRQLARHNGPYFQPARYLVDGASADAAGDGTARRAAVPKGLVGPVFRGDWARGGEVLIDDAAWLLHHDGFVEAAREMYRTELVEPEQVYVNLTTPMAGNGHSHVDIPEFVGIDRTNAPGWLLQAMGSSRLFEEHRITIATAVAWFYRGERGFFRYWPSGRDRDSVRHESMWNTAVVGDNDFMHHKVEGVGARGEQPPPEMTIDAELECRDGSWVIVDDTVAESGGDRDLARYHDDQVRLSLSWKARVYADEAHRDRVVDATDPLTIERVVERFLGALDHESDVSGDAALHDESFRTALTTRWSGYVPG